GVGRPYTLLVGRPYVLLVVIPYCFPIGDYVLIVLFQGTCKAVMALGVGNEIVIIGLGRMHGGFQGAAAGISDGAGGQAGVTVGVVGGGELHIGVVQCPLVCARNQFGVDDAGVGSEGDPPVQPVVVDAGDQGALFRDRGLFLDY